MTETRTLHDPFLGKDVEISDRLVDRLRGRYANGPTMPNGEPEFGWCEFQTPPIQHEAAAEITLLRSELEQAKGQVESLRNALEPFIALRDQSPTQMAKVIHKGIAGTIPIALTVTKDQFKAACSAFGLSPSPSSTKCQGDGQ